MNVYAIFLRWTAASGDPYPDLSQIGATEDAPPEDKAFKAAIDQFVNTVSKDPGFLYYSRVRKGSVTITTVFYKSKADYDALRVKFAKELEDLEMARGPFAAARGVTVEEKQGEFEFGTFDESNFEETSAFFDSLA